MHMYGHGLRKEITPYLLYAGMNLTITRIPVDPNSLPSNCVAVFPELAIILNPLVEQIVVLNYTTQDNKRVLEDESNKIVKLHRLEMSIDSCMSTFHSMVEAEKHNVRLQKTFTLAKNENPAIMSNKEQGND